MDTRVRLVVKVGGPLVSAMNPAERPTLRPAVLRAQSPEKPVKYSHLGVAPS